MTTFGFYHLTRLSLEDALAKLLVKTVQSGERALVRLGPNVDMEGLDRALWTFDDASFLPHGKAADARAPRQPVLLAKADACACGENPNGAGMLFLVDDPPVDDAGIFARCFYLFDGRDPDAVEAARRRWRDVGVRGWQRRYWQQDENGRWCARDDA
ncbi:MAG: DNA polymerase III subunit chi [Geminicoccaceae bacterium]|nr:DNA polymerase III subunit chi [Geminicoccaceae bacterium]